MSETIGSEWDDIKSLLFQLRQVHNAHLTKWRTEHSDDTPSWTIAEQLLHVHSEVSELYEELREGPKPGDVPTTENNPYRDRLILEVWDICFTAIAAAQIMRFSDDEILQGMVNCLRKIQGRVRLLEVQHREGSEVKP